MTEPIRLYVRLTYEGLPMGNSRSCDAFFRKEDAKLRMFGFESTVELTEVRRCATCVHRQPDTEEDDTTLGGDEFMSCAMFPDYPDKEFLARVADGTGHCHMHKEKTDG